MRHCFFLLLFSLALPLAAAAQPAGSLTVFSEQGEPFYLLLNGRRMNDTRSPAVRIDSLPARTYGLKVIFRDSGTVGSVVDLPAGGRGLTYRILRDRRGVRRLERGGFFRNGGRLYQRSWQEPPPVEVPAQNPAPQDGKPVTCRFAMKPADFNAAKQTVSSSNFDETRLSTARSIISGNCVTTDQVIELCQLLTFESNKLDFAKIAYGRVVDPANYFRVNNIFKFESNKRELNRFVAGY